MEVFLVVSGVAFVVEGQRAGVDGADPRGVATMVVDKGAAALEAVEAGLLAAWQEALEAVFVGALRVVLTAAAQEAGMGGARVGEQEVATEAGVAAPEAEPLAMGATGVEQTAMAQAVVVMAGTTAVVVWRGAVAGSRLVVQEATVAAGKVGDPVAPRADERVAAEAATVAARAAR
eukprot:4615772-Prymnesium_polylepis.1